jgi:hypothetical protein
MRSSQSEISKNRSRELREQAKKQQSTEKGQAQRLTDMVVLVNFSDCSGSLSWGLSL